jgi:AraC-like DNA-binding protein
MDSTDGRIVIMRPDAVAAAAVISDEVTAHSKTGTELIVGHDLVVFVARGEGWYRTSGRTGALRPNTLLTIPAGSFACQLGDEREMYVLATRQPPESSDDLNAYSPFFERRLGAAEGRHWRDRMADNADRVQNGRFCTDDIRQLKRSVSAYVWQHEANGTRTTLQHVFASIWTHMAEPLTLERLAGDVGYTANYLNDLTRLHTGRPLGGWIAEMRMARARTALERTDLPVAEIGVMCGYDDPAYFSRAFRRAHGVPPATWRIGARPVDSRHAGVTIPLDVLHEIETLRMLPQRAYSFAS